MGNTPPSTPSATPLGKLDLLIEREENSGDQFRSDLLDLYVNHFGALQLEDLFTLKEALEAHMVHRLRTCRNKGNTTDMNFFLTSTSPSSSGCVSNYYINGPRSCIENFDKKMQSKNEEYMTSKNKDQTKTKDEEKQPVDKRTSESISSLSFHEKAIHYWSQGLQADNEKEALRLYQFGLEYIMAAIKCEKDLTKSDEMRKQAFFYLKKAEMIKDKLKNEMRKHVPDDLAIEEYAGQKPEELLNGISDQTNDFVLQERLNSLRKNNE